MQDDPGGEQHELVEELERMLNEQLLVNPDDVKLHLRLAQVYAQRKRRDAFLGEAQDIHRLTKGDDKHPAMHQIHQLAGKLGVDPNIISLRSDANHQRRLGEDQASREYFEHLDSRYRELNGKPGLVQSLDRVLLRNFNRPSSLMYAQRFSDINGGAQIALKREDLLGNGTKLIMAVTGQVVMARLLGYKVVVTGSQNMRAGVLMATMAARLGLGAVIYINQRYGTQSTTAILHMRCLGARIETADSYQSARDEAVEACTRNPERHFLVMGVDAAPNPYPELNQQLISGLGREVRAQSQAMFKRPPDALVSRGSSSADAFGFFDPFLDQADTRLVAVEGRDTLTEESQDDTSAFSRTMQLSNSQLQQAETILEGSEYPSVRREHAKYKASERVEYVKGSSHDAQAVLKGFARHEGLILPIRTAYAIGWAARAARDMDKDKLIVINMVEAYDKDLREVANVLGYKRD